MCEFTYMIISNWHGVHVFKFQVSEFIVVERFTEIERENRILLEKMTNILQNPNGFEPEAPFKLQTSLRAFSSESTHANLARKRNAPPEDMHRTPTSWKFQPPLGWKNTRRTRRNKPDTPPGIFSSRFISTTVSVNQPISRVRNQSGRSISVQYTFIKHRPSSGLSGFPGFTSSKYKTSLPMPSWTLLRNMPP